MKVFEIAKVPACWEVLIKIKVGSKIFVPYSKAKGYREAISRKIKEDFPKMQFTTERVEKDGIYYLSIYREKDLITTKKTA